MLRVFLFFREIALLDKLEAVNRSLTAIGEARVNSLDTGLPDAELAASILDEVREDVLQVGWYENTREGVSMSPEINTGQIPIPRTWYAIEAHNIEGKVIIKTDVNDGVRKLFEANEQTFVFDQSLVLRVIHSVEFDDLSFPLKNYISARAARTFQERTMGSQSLDGFVSRAEAEAWSKLLDAEADTANHNVLTDSPYMAAVTGRNNNLSWR